MVFAKKVGHFVGKYAERVRHEKKRRNRAAAGTVKRRGKRKKSKPTCKQRPPKATIRFGPKIGVPSLPDRETRPCSSHDTPSVSKTVTIANVTIPAPLVDVSVGRKHKEGERWVLTSRHGMHIAVFTFEADLDRWWWTFQESRGRTPRPLLTGRTLEHQQRRTNRLGQIGTRPITQGDYLKPWSDRYDMPEIDLE